MRGADNVVADCLSRTVNSTTVDACDLIGIAQAQISDEEMQQFSDRLSPFELKPDLKLYCETSTAAPLPYVPLSLRTSVISSLHSLSHPGFKGASRLVKHRYFWSTVDTDVRNFIRTCLDCQRSKVHRHTKCPVEPLLIPSERFQTVHIDIVGALPPATCSSQSAPLPFQYCLTMIDRATRWMEAVPIVDITAAFVAVALVQGWISCFGVPLHIITDRGAQFESELFHHLRSIIGFHRIRTNGYHPQPNGMVECLHRKMKDAIKATGENWYNALPIVLLGLRMTISPTGFSPFTAVTGADILCPQLFISKDTNTPQSLNSTIKTLIDEMRKIDFVSLSAGYCKSVPNPFIPKDLSSCTHVWVRIDHVR